MSEEREYGTNFRQINVEKEVRDAYQRINSQDQGFYRKRIADFFLVGASRSFNLNLRPLKLTKNKKLKFPVFNISTHDPGPKRRTLVDKEKFWRYFRVLAYAYNIKNAGTDENTNEWKESHHVIIDGSKCCAIAEHFFKGGWNNPPDTCFSTLIDRDYPDDEIYHELDLTLEDEELAEEILTEEEIYKNNGEAT